MAQKIFEESAAPSQVPARRPRQASKKRYFRAVLHAAGPRVSRKSDPLGSHTSLDVACPWMWPVGSWGRGMVRGTPFPKMSPFPNYASNTGCGIRMCGCVAVRAARGAFWPFWSSDFRQTKPSPSHRRAAFRPRGLALSPKTSRRTPRCGW